MSQCKAPLLPTKKKNLNHDSVQGPFCGLIAPMKSRGRLDHARAENKHGRPRPTASSARDRRVFFVFCVCLALSLELRCALLSATEARFSFAKTTLQPCLLAGGATRRRPHTPACGVPLQYRTLVRLEATSTTAAQWCLWCVHAQTRNSCKRLRKKPADPFEWPRKGRFRPQQFAQRKSAPSGLSSLHHRSCLEALNTAIAFPQPGRRFPALRQ